MLDPAPVILRVFPAALFTVNSIEIYVRSDPSALYDGEAIVTFRAEAMDLSSNNAVSSLTEILIETAFYHCEPGNFWGIDGDEETCKLCTNIDVGDADVSTLGTAGTVCATCFSVRQMCVCLILLQYATQF